MKLLLTGSKGFIGSYFLNAYGSAYAVRCFSFLRERFAELDISGIDTVVHLSALVHQMDGASDDAYEEVNVDNTLALARKAKTGGVRHFIFMSSVKVYGEENLRPYDERTPCSPADAYGKSKLKAENALLELADDDFAVSVIRTPVVYGEGVKGNIRSLLRLVDKSPVLPFGGIENRRSMVYVGNLCALVDVLVRSGQGGLFLASDAAPLSTTSLIREIAAALGKQRVLFACPLLGLLLRRFRPTLHARLFGSLWLDVQRSNTRVGFTPPFSTRKGIEAMVRRYKNVD